MLQVLSALGSGALRGDTGKLAHLLGSQSLLYEAAANECAQIAEELTVKKRLSPSK